MKIICWNVNGIRALARKGAFQWLIDEGPDIFCLQETKAHPDQLEASLVTPPGYHSHFAWAEKKGYSGVAIFSKKKPKKVTTGIGKSEFDREGRTLTCEFEKFTLINVYVPNGQPDHGRVPYKLKFCEQFLKHCEKHRKKQPNLVLCGDFNIAHEDIDLARPKENQDTTGFLPIERKWLHQFIEKKKYVDIFRSFEPGPKQYTWWSYRPGVRERNIGWRIDYFFVSSEFKKSIKRATIQPEIMGSDHCPVRLEF
jgi:exodeoxyribonuclease III